PILANAMRCLDFWFVDAKVRGVWGGGTHIFKKKFVNAVAHQKKRLHPASSGCACRVQPADGIAEARLSYFLKKRL
ncbi:MAG: hypothetical protein K2J17_02310, partial [Paramuribaculum sp.]|nr:hypothetical protein [Paramuribaculum sp.]